MQLNPTELVNQYGRLVSSICRRMVQDPVLAEDAAQEAWLKILSGISTFKGSAKLSTWLYSVVKHEVYRFTKKEKTYQFRNLKKIFLKEERTLPVHLDKIETKLWIKEQCDNCITGMLHCLSDDARLIYVFRNIVKMPYTDIAYIMDKEETVIRKSYSRSRKKLKKFMAGNCPVYRPGNHCQCRSAKLVRQIDLSGEYNSLHKIIKLVDFFRKSETILPRKNYWEKFLSF